MFLFPISFCTHGQLLHNKTISEIIKHNTETKSSQVITGINPRAMGIDDFKNSVYVANADYNSIYVIITAINERLGNDMPVGNSPQAIDIDSYTNTIYVANIGSNDISVIDGLANKVVAGIKFNVNPFNSGYILCKSLQTSSH